MEAPIFELQSRRDQIDLKIAELRAILDGDTSSQTAAPTCTPAKRAIYRIMIPPNIHTGKKGAPRVHRFNGVGRSGLVRYDRRSADLAISGVTRVL
jgi:hypothetical protein